MTKSDIIILILVLLLGATIGSYATYVILKKESIINPITNEIKIDSAVHSATDSALIAKSDSFAAAHGLK